jgi:uncharacterized protein (TIGR03089 family)
VTDPAASGPATWPDRHLGGLGAAAARTNGQRPFVTFGDGATGERVELGCGTFENWVAKTANLLVDDLALRPGDVLATDLGTHWTALVIVAAAWRAGVTVALPGAWDGAGALAAREDRAATRLDVPTVVVGTGMAARCTAPPGDAIPFAEDVLGYPDDFDDHRGAPEEPAAQVPSPGGTTVRSHAELVRGAGWLARIAGIAMGDRYASEVPADEEVGLLAAPTLALLLGGGLVLLRETSPDARARIVADERCSVLLVPSGSAASGAIPPGCTLAEIPRPDRVPYRNMQDQKW